MERTYRREDFLESRRQWETGKYDGRWDKYRKLAAERGFIYPPTGSRYDSWEDDEPSQRAVVWQAIVDTPLLLEEAIAKSRSWGDVVRKLLYERQVMRDEMRLRERDDEWERETAPRIHAPELLATIVQRVKDSMP